MITTSNFGTLPDGRTITKYRVENSFGEYVELLDFGACIYSVYVRDASGELGDVIIGVKDPEQLAKGGMAGVTVGRCANRIAYGRFELNGKPVQLECNMGGHYLHGASGAYGKQLFRAQADEASNMVRFFHTDLGEGGFGNRVEVEVDISFNDAHQLKISYKMTGAEDTILCPTNHAYFNLNGSSDIREQTLCIHAGEYAIKGELGMPQGGTASVAGTPLDFRSPERIGEALKAENSGFFTRQPPELDDTFILDNCAGRRFGLAAELASEASGRRMTVSTDMPALIAFTMFLRRPVEGKRAEPYEGYCSIALETQYVPNAVNCPDFDAPVFRANEPLISSTVYEFSTIPRLHTGE